MPTNIFNATSTFVIAIIITISVSAIFSFVVVFNRVCAVAGSNTIIHLTSSEACVEYATNVEVPVCTKRGTVYKYYRISVLDGPLWELTSTELVSVEVANEAITL